MLLLALRLTYTVIYLVLPAAVSLLRDAHTVLPLSPLLLIMLLLVVVLLLSSTMLLLLSSTLLLLVLLVVLLLLPFVRVVL